MHPAHAEDLLNSHMEALQRGEFLSGEFQRADPAFFDVGVFVGDVEVEGADGVVEVQRSLFCAADEVVEEDGAGECEGVCACGDEFGFVVNLAACAEEGEVDFLMRF